jgi:Rrf2 family iron-sulfur cluster assembly transcriptional regulator
VPVRRGRRGPLYPADLLQSPLYSRTCKDAFRLLERLAETAIQSPGALRKLDALGAEIGLSTPEVEQVAHFLRLAGLVEVPGLPSEGVRLARSASRISLLEVVRATDGSGLWGRCILGLAECSDEMPCPAHAAWKEAHALLEQHLDSQSLADLNRAVARRGRTQETGASGWR